jgi:mono/diheme cytochrome c family protein
VESSAISSNPEPATFRGQLGRKKAMKRLFIGAAATGIGVIVLAAPSYAQGGDIGKHEYITNCAVCHGEKGNGDGPLRTFLTKPPADLTAIQKNNSGVFRFDRIYEVIDGRQAVAAHGPREMPVWGAAYRAVGVASSGGNASEQELQSFARGRLIALIGYIYTLQSK